jgi:hypothetical protein
LERRIIKYEKITEREREREREGERERERENPSLLCKFPISSSISV